MGHHPHANWQEACLKEQRVMLRSSGAMKEQRLPISTLRDMDTSTVAKLIAPQSWRHRTRRLRQRRPLRAARQSRCGRA